MRVVPDVPAIHRRFDYTVPLALDEEIGVGSRVRVDLHGRRVGGWVVEDRVDPVAGVEAKPLAASSGMGPPASVVSLAEWAAWRWAGPLSSFLGTASPSRVVRRPVARPDDPTDGGHHPLRSPGRPPPSPGGGSVTLVAGLLEGQGGVAVVRLAPALDAALVVLELIHRLGADGVLALAPSHVRARALAVRLRQAGVTVALLPEQWAEASAGHAAVVGTRAAAWAPLDRLRAAVVLDAHDEAYREERSPTWSAVDVVVERGRRDGAPVALVTPCPPVALTENRPLVTTTRPVERRGWPLVEVVDRTGDDPRTGLFSERLVHRLRGVLDGPEGRAVCILNRTGRLRLLACTECGALVRCGRCGGAMTQDEKDGPLRCRRGDETRPPVCAVCDSPRLRTLRIGVRRATEELAALTHTEAVEITASSEPGHGDRAPLVVGTEAALHRQSWADLVAFVDIDQHLLAPRFGAGEETLALLARAARLVGAHHGRVLVQTRLPDHEALRAAVQADPGVLTEVERPLRRTLDLPPFGALATVGGPGASALAADIGAAGGVTVSSLEEARWLVRAPDHQQLCDRLAAVPRPAQRVRVEVDPVDV